MNKINIESLEEIEKYILHKVSLLDLNFENLNKEYNFHKIYVDLLNFCTLDLIFFIF